MSSSSRRIKIHPVPSSALVFISLCSNTHSESCYYTDYPDELVRSSPSHSAHADCNLEITPNEEFLKNTAATLCCQLHAAPGPNGFPGMESIFPLFCPTGGPASQALPPSLLRSHPPPVSPTLHPPPGSTNWGRLVLVKRSHNHCFCC